MQQAKAQIKIPKSEAASKNTRTPTTTPPPAMPFVTRINGFNRKGIYPNTCMSAA
jgi:hypothetical protein